MKESSLWEEKKFIFHSQDELIERKRTPIIQRIGIDFGFISCFLSILPFRFPFSTGFETLMLPSILNL